MFYNLNAKETTLVEDTLLNTSNNEQSAFIFERKYTRVKQYDIAIFLGIESRKYRKPSQPAESPK